MAHENFDKMRNDRSPDGEGPTKPAAGARDIAAIAPFTVRSLLGLVEERGLSPEAICRGLGFTFEDLQEQDLLLSYNQTRHVILRTQQLLQEPALGLLAGARQTPISWGVVGLAMLTCKTLGEAIEYGLSYQGVAGSMVNFRMVHYSDSVSLEVTPRQHDLRIDDFIVDEAFAGAFAIARYLVGPKFSVSRVDLARDPASRARIYQAFYHCPVFFNSGANGLVFPSHWLTARLPTYDRVVSGFVQRQLNGILKLPIGRHDLVESVSSRLRGGSAPRIRQGIFAESVNMSERTLRRRLRENDTSFRDLAEENRYELARDQLTNSTATIEEVALSMGYANARSFRRAFKRWSGVAPQDFRSASRREQASDSDVSR